MKRFADWKVLNQKIVDCASCPRLVRYRLGIAQKKKRQFINQSYWGKPVAGFGDIQARLLLIGLAPAAHGANRTGRIFTGDSSGNWLFEALYRFGFANQPNSTGCQDGMKIKDVFISAAVRCAPPQNRPSAQELMRCRSFLHSEFLLLRSIRIIVVLGRVALDSFWSLYPFLYPNINQAAKPKFLHGGITRLPDGKWLLTSYHPSRQNTQTGRLTRAMWNEIFSKTKTLLDDEQIL